MQTQYCNNCNTYTNILYGCFGQNVPILLFDKTTKMSQDICIGDKLLGDDFTERIVQDVMEGHDDIFEIKQTNGINYVVNSKHTLLLKHILTDEEHMILEISTEQFMSLNHLYKNMLLGYKILPDNIETNTDINVTYMGRGIYYGFAIGNNKRFFLNDYTVVHNCNTTFCSKCNTIY